MLITTTSSIQNREIEEYLGIVSSEAILGANIVRDIFAGIRDIVGGRSGAYEEKLAEAKKIVTEEMIRQAQDLGANAVLAVDYDFETVGSQGSMLMCVATGTAVRIKSL